MNLMVSLVVLLRSVERLMSDVDSSKINHNLIRPVKEDYSDWIEYHDKLMEYLYLKFKDTYSNGDGTKPL